GHDRPGPPGSAAAQPCQLPCPRPKTAQRVARPLKPRTAGAGRRAPAATRPGVGAENQSLLSCLDQELAGVLDNVDVVPEGARRAVFTFCNKCTPWFTRAVPPNGAGPTRLARGSHRHRTGIM